MKKIELVTTESDNISIKQTSDSSSEYYLLGGDQALLCNDSNLRVARISELNERLKLRDWNVTGRRYAFEDFENGDLCYLLDDTSSGNGIVNVVSRDNTNHIVISNNLPNDNNKSELQNFIDNELSEELKEIYNSMSNSEVYLYSVTKNTVDILNNSITIDVIPYNSDIYTNTIDLGNLVNYSASPGVSTRVDLGIQYSKNVVEEKIGEDGQVTDISRVEKLYSKETTFSGFKYILDITGNIELVNNNYIENIGSDVIIEYVNNIIRIIPNSIDVDECIISNCTVTYGKL